MHIPLNPDGGKGSKWRHINFEKYRNNYDAIFRKKKKKKLNFTNVRFSSKSTASKNRD